MDLIFDSNNKYGRSTSPEHTQLCLKLSNLYSATAYVVSSGMNAISTLFRVILDRSNEPYHLVYADELYCDLFRLFEYFNKSNKLILHPVLITKTNEIKSLLSSLKDQQVIFYFETCSNPHGLIFEFDTIPLLKTENKDLLVIVDNTWVTSAVFNPLDHGADVVVSSLTKYYSNSQAMGGVIVSRSYLMTEVERYIRFHGLHVSPYDCKVINDNIDSLKDRMIRAYNTMLELFQLMNSNDKFKNILHPVYESHPSHDQYLKYFNPNIGCSVFTVRIKGNEKAMKRLRDKFKYINYKTSFGGPDTRYDPWYKGTQEGYTHCRISVGDLSTVKEIYGDLNL